MTDKTLNALKESWNQLVEMPAWNDGDKNISSYLGSRSINDVVRSKSESDDKVIEKFQFKDYVILVFTSKYENFYDLYIFLNDKEVAAFNWMKQGKGFWKTVSAAVSAQHQGTGLAIKAYTHMIDKYFHTLMSDATLTGETGGKGSFDLWAKLGKIYPFKYIINKHSKNLTPVNEFTRDMMGNDFEYFVVSQVEL